MTDVGVTAADIAAKLEAAPPLPIHTQWACTIGLGCFLDGYTTLAVAAALTVLVKELHFDFARVGLLISASFAGMLVGAMLLGAASERIGRKTVFVTSVALFGALSLAAASAWDFNSLFWLRVVQGIGLGGAVPVGAALLTECLPAPARGRTFSLTFALLFSLGYVLAPLAGFVLIKTLGPALGWRALFMTAGIALPFAGLAWFVLPESPRWLASQGRTADALRILEKVSSSARLSGKVLSVATVQPYVAPTKTRLREAFSPAYAGRTMLVWVLFFTVYFVQYGLNSWLPSLYVKIGGLPPDRALLLSVVNGCVTLGAAVAFAVTVDRVGRKTWFIIGYGLGLFGIGAGITLVAALHVTAWPALFASALFMTAGTGVNAGSIYLYAPELFPTRMRSWCTSTGSAASRLGSIIAPLAIGALLQAQLGLVSVLALLGGSCAAGLAAIALFGIETKQRSLEELAS